MDIPETLVEKGYALENGQKAMERTKSFGSIMRDKDDWNDKDY